MTKVHDWIQTNGPSLPDYDEADGADERDEFAREMTELSKAVTKVKNFTAAAGSLPDPDRMFYLCESLDRRYAELADELDDERRAVSLCQEHIAGLRELLALALEVDEYDASVTTEAKLKSEKHLEFIRRAKSALREDMPGFNF